MKPLPPRCHPSSLVPGWSGADFVGGHPVLDLVNTVADTGKSRQETRLITWDDFRSWQDASARIHPGGADPFIDTDASRRRRVLGRIHAFREHAFALLSAMARGSAPDADALSAIERAIVSAMSRASLTVIGSPGALWRPGEDALHHHVDRFALQLDGLLRGGDIGQLRECGRCTWLFLDRGRGAGRRWCDMRTCGNRAKAEAFRHRSSDA